MVPMVPIYFLTKFSNSLTKSNPGLGKVKAEIVDKLGKVR